MARIRTIKPGFFQSDDVAALGFRARLTWVGLWTYCDDAGRAKDNAKLIKAAVWPLDDDVTVYDVEQDLCLLARHGRIVRYEVDGNRYLAVTNWEQHQRVNRPNDSQIPGFTEGSVRTHGGLTEDSLNTPGNDHAAIDASTTDPAEPQDTGDSVSPHGRLTEDSLTAHGALTEDSLSPHCGNKEVEVEGNKEVEQGGCGGDAPTGAPRDDVDRLCTHLAARIAGNGSNRPTVTRKWRDAARLMLDRDGRTEPEVHFAIDWCQDHEFWRSNILGMPKLRAKYDQLRLQAQRQRSSDRGYRSPTDANIAALLGSPRTVDGSVG